MQSASKSTRLIDVRCGHPFKECPEDCLANVSHRSKTGKGSGLQTPLEVEMANLVFCCVLLVESELISRCYAVAMEKNIGPFRFRGVL